MNQPLFSILVANYNHGRYIGEALNSIINQTYKNVEVIIVDDHSTDNSIEIIQSFLKKYPAIKFHKNIRNRGYGYSLKKAMDLSNGEYIGRLDPDDSLEKNAVERITGTFQSNPDHALVYTTHYLCDKDLKIEKITPHSGPVPEGNSYLTFPGNIHNNISHFACFNRSKYLETPGINPKFKKAVDKDLYYKLEEVGPVLFINEPLYYYRQHDEAISQNTERFKALLWEVRARRSARRRRIGKKIPNLTKAAVQQEFKMVYLELFKQEILKRNYLKGIFYFFNLGIYSRNIPMLMKTIYSVFTGKPDKQQYA